MIRVSGFVFGRVVIFSRLFSLLSFPFFLTVYIFLTEGTERMDFLNRPENDYCHLFFLYLFSLVLFGLFFFSVFPISAAAHSKI
jgi:hypothetical protein